MKDVTFITVTLGQTVKTYTEDPFTSITSQTTVDVYNAIPSVEVTLSAFQIAPSGSVNFNSSVPSTPGNYGNVFFIFNFGDGSAADNSSSGSVSHTFTAIGNYSITVTATNGPSSVSVTRFVEVHEQIAGLNLTYDGPKMTNDPITFTANASRGNFLTYQFESTLFNVTQKLSTFSHTFANKGNYLITLTASNALSSQHTTLTAYILSPTEILIVSLKLNGTAISGCYETNLSHTLSVEVIHYDKTRLLYDWDFGNSVVISNSLSTQHQGYTFAGNFTLKVTAKYTPQNASIQQSVDLCLEERISTPEIQLTSPVALPPSGTASKNVTVTVRTGSPLHYQWLTNATTTGSATGSSIGVQFLGEGYYNLNVTLNNNINTVAVSKVVQVIQEISGLAISCTSCITKAGNFYVQRNVANNYMVSISTGSQVTYSWDMGDTNTSQGATKTHRYGATGQYNITVTVSNPVTSSLKKTVTIHVEDPITSVTLDFSGYDWLANLVPATTNIKNLDISKIGKFQVAVQPTGMSLEYSWTFDTGLTPLVSTSNQGSYSYTSLGWKSVTVKASNLLNNMTSATLGFYVITAITDINVTENGNQLSTTSNYTVGINKPYTFTATSNQATPGSVTYLFIVRENGVLVAISNNDTSPSYTYNFTSEKSYRLLISVKNSQTPTNFEKSYNIEPIKSITGAFITAPAGENGNITLGSSITLTGGCADGKYPKYRWYYAQAPAGELIPTHPTNTTVITITPTQVGMYIIQLEVYNYVSIPQNATYRLNVQTGVSGVSIDVSLPFPDAVEIGSSKTFNAVVTAGTDVTYNWTLYENGSKIGTGDHQFYNVNFSKQALYNITLEVKNFASSESKFIEIYSLIHVPYFELEVIGGSQISGGSGIAAKTGTSLTFLPNISFVSFISFLYTINGTSEKNSSTLAKTFSSADHYIVSLNAENKISTQSSQQLIVIQDPIMGLVVQGCNHTVLLGTAYTLIASQSQGTEVSYSWTKDGAVSTGPSVVVQYDIVGNYSVNLNAENYVSDKMLYCYVTYLGVIGNLQITKSHYSYLNFPVTFTVSGVYIDPANFTWTFSHGPGPEHTKYPSLTITFTTAGSYDLSVVVDNGVSQDVVNFTFVMEGLLCSVPKVSPHGSLQRTTLRSRVIEFAVTVETNDCNKYTSANEWVIYQANSCSAPLKNIFNLSSSVHINTPELRVPVRTLSYGTYCVTFRHQYQKTPVTETVKFNLTIEPTDLVTIIAGGDELSTVEGSELTLDGTLSYDPDLEPNTVLGYRWSCLQTAGINTGVCSKINTVTSSLVTLTSLTLTSGDEYNVTLTVTAPGRISSSKSQLIHIASSTIPRVETTCVSCIANGHYTLIASKSVSIEGKCLSGCTALTSYSWTVTDMSTNTPVSVNSTATTTGTNKLNFVLKANALSGSKNYAFKLQATEGSKFGYAQFVLPPSSIPSGGLCTVSKTSNVIPLKDRLMISCQNYVDLDTMSGIYYQVKVISTSKAEEYIAYYGTRSVNWIYLAPFANTSFEAITIQVNVLNDYGSKGTGNTFTVSFAHPTLAANQANNVDFIRDHMISTLPTIVNQNNPVLLVQYCTAALSFLNDQSQQGVSSNEIRMALREVVAHSLSGLPLGNIYTVQQMSNAIEYLAAFPNELSSNILQIVSSEIESLAKAMETMVKKGHDQTDYEPDKLLNTITNIQRALQLTTTNISDIGTLAMFGDLKKYQLEVSSGVAVKVYGNLEEQIKSMIIKTVEYTNQLMIVPLRSLLADEEPIQIKLSDGSVTMGMHVSVNKLQEDFQVAGVKLDVPPSVVAYTSYSQSSIFELFTASTINPYNFGLDTSDLNTNTLSIGFYSIDGSTVKVANLPDSSAITMYLFDRDSTPYVINSSGLVYSNRYDPLGNMSYSTSSKPLKGNTNYQTSTLTLPSASGESLHVQIRVNFTDSVRRTNCNAEEEWCFI
ncbi:hypothetical protein DPMN_027168 [Dreissena polymorpha]|uniref:Uncharacterized protein n=1 Tax=Dreissena polymorpha TaxID=45954 RepID=A0A9D4LUT2_DREPO|nr:hypothetical protein DPMN_027168 [Dreissena polymorpha]